MERQKPAASVDHDPFNHRMISEHDTLECRCPRLGHEIAFAYCRSPGEAIPCRKVFDCWWEAFNIEEFIRTHYSPEILAKLLQPPRDKSATLMDLVRQAQQAAQAGNSDSAA
jgi:hypothetical protein